jgi:TIR domain
VWTRLVEADGGARSWELVPIASSKCVSRGRRGRLEAGVTKRLAGVVKCFDKERGVWQTPRPSSSLSPILPNLHLSCCSSVFRSRPQTRFPFFKSDRLTPRPVWKCETKDRSPVRIFISFAHDDADLAAQLEAALRRSNIDTWSTLDIAPGEDWTQAIDKKSASADGYVFLLGPGAPENPQLRAEWRSLLRNDWESKKSLIPVILAHGSVPHDLPPSCGTGGRSSQPISTTRSARSAT